jgi:hypothetical protein
MDDGEGRLFPVEFQRVNQHVLPLPDESIPGRTEYAGHAQRERRDAHAPDKTRQTPHRQRPFLRSEAKLLIRAGRVTVNGAVPRRRRRSSTRRAT